MPIKFSRKEEGSKETKEIGTGELRSWIRRIEQNIDSLDKRLDAIERRLSGEKFVPPKMGKRGEEGRGYSEALEDEIRFLSKKMNDEIKTIRTELLKFEGVGRAISSGSKEGAISNKKSPKVLSLNKPEEKKMVTTSGPTYTRELADLERRMERLEKRKATVKVGRIEVPIEITGIVGGMLAFVIAALLFEGYKDMVISPVFVMFIGIVLVFAAALKTYVINISKR